MTAPQPLRINVLGPVEVLVDGVPVAVGRPKQRVLLAVLLSRRGEMVSVGELTVALWGNRAPQSAADNLRLYVHGLRRVLGADALGGHGRPGYRLTADHLAVDALEFLALADAGQRAGDPATAGRLLREALGRWRGRPFADLGDVPALAVETARLEEARLLAVERRVDADLQTGAGAALTGELTALVTRHPHRERFVEQLMRALYRSGRQVEALAVYRRARATLHQDLGVEPGAALAALQQAILRRDPQLDPPGAEAPVVRAGPALLPRDVPGFAGRVTELAWLDGTLTGAGAGLALLLGTAGVGKTALAVHWAHRVRDLFPDGQLYLNLRGFDPGGAAVPPAEAVHLLLEALDVPPEQIPHTLEGRTALYRTLLADRRVLIVLDNARDAEQVRALLPGTGRCPVLVTSRHRLTGLVAIDDARPLALGLMSDSEALDLLRRRLGEDRVAREPAAADELVARCARLPLALVIVAARAATEPDLALAAILAELGGGDRLGAFADDDAMTDVRTVFSWSYDALAPPAARLFRLIGLVFAAEFTDGAAASLAGLPVGPARTLLAQLTRAHLLTERAPGRYTVHDLLRAYAAELAAGTDCAGALDRLVDHYLHTAHHAAVRLNPHRDPIALGPRHDGVTVTRFADAGAATAWFEAEYRVLLAIPDHPALPRATVWRLAWTVWDFFNRRGYWADWVTLQHTALAAAEATDDDEGRASAHRGLTLAYGRLGRYRDVEKHLHQALTLFEALGDDLGRAHVHFTFSWLYEQEGADEAAVEQAERALRLFESAGHRFGQAQALNAVGWRNAQLGRYRLALRHCRRALGLLEELDDRYGQATTLDSLGFANHRLGRYPTAVTCFERAIRLFREFGDRYNEAESLTRLGDSHRAAGSDPAAATAWRAALILFEDLQHAAAADVRERLASIRTGTAEPMSPG